MISEGSMTVSDIVQQSQSAFRSSMASSHILSTGMNLAKEKLTAILSNMLRLEEETLINAKNEENQLNNRSNMTSFHITGYEFWCRFQETNATERKWRRVFQQVKSTAKDSSAAK